MPALKTTLKSLLRRSVSALSDRIGRIRVLFLVSNEIGFANQAPLIEALQHDARFYIATHTTDTDPEIDAFAQAPLFQLYRVGSVRAHVTPWHYIITSDTLEFWPLWNAIGVSIEHGSSIGNIHRRPDHEIWALRILTANNISIAFVPGQEHLKLLAERYPAIRNAPHKAFFDCGVAKLAELPALSAQRADTLTRLELDPHRKTVLIASHWTPLSLLRDLGAELVEWACRYHLDSNIILTGHPMLWTLKPQPDFNSAALIEQIQALQQRHKNLRFVPTGMPMSLLAAADQLICDHSSIRVEFALLDRPTALYRNPGFVCESARTDRLYRDASWVFSDLDTLELAQQQMDAHPNAKSAANQTLARHFVTDPSLTVNKIHTTLAHAGRISSPHSNGWLRVKALEQRAADAAQAQQISA